MGYSTSCSIRLFPRQSSPTLVPLCPHSEAPSLPDPLLPPYLESCVEMVLRRHPLSPREAPEIVVQPPRPQFTSHHAGHSSHHFCFLPRPPALVMGPLCSPPPAGTQPSLTSSSGLLTALRKQAEGARGSCAKQSCLGHGNPGQTGEV